MVHPASENSMKYMHGGVGGWGVTSWRCRKKTPTNLQSTSERFLLCENICCAVRAEEPFPVARFQTSMMITMAASVARCYTDDPFRRDIKESPRSLEIQSHGFPLALVNNRHDRCDPLVKTVRSKREESVGPLEDKKNSIFMPTFVLKPKIASSVKRANKWSPIRRVPRCSSPSSLTKSPLGLILEHLVFIFHDSKISSPLATSHYIKFAKCSEIKKFEPVKKDSFLFHSEKRNVCVSIPSMCIMHSFLCKLRKEVSLASFLACCLIT